MYEKRRKSHTLMQEILTLHISGRVSLYNRAKSSFLAKCLSKYQSHFDSVSRQIRLTEGACHQQLMALFKGCVRHGVCVISAFSLLPRETEEQQENSATSHDIITPKKTRLKKYEKAIPAFNSLIAFTLSLPPEKFDVF